MWGWANNSPSQYKMSVYDPILVSDINVRLKDKFGIVVDGSAKFRIVLADTEFETRKDKFRDYIDEEKTRLLREVEEVRRVPKYEAWSGYYILERYHEGKYMPPDIYDYNRYDCLYVFKKKDGSPQELSWLPIEFLINGIILQSDDPVIKQKTYKHYAQEFMKAQEKEKKLFFEILDNESPYIAGMLGSGEAVTVPNMSDNLPKTPFKD